MTKKSKARTPRGDGVVVPAGKTEIDESTIDRGKMIPIELLRIVTNARKEHVYDPMLAASLVSAGQLKPFMVFLANDAKGDYYDVVGGGRRLTAMLRINKDRPELFAEVRCDVYQNGMAAIEASLHDNVQREMHDLDWYESIAKLMDTGADETETARHFGKPVEWVRRMAKLGNLSPDVREAYRAGKLDERAAVAYTLLSAEDQVKLLKRGVRQEYQVKDEISRRMIQVGGKLMTTTDEYGDEYDVDQNARGSFAKFRLEDIPADKKTTDLFSDNVFVDRDWFFEQQNAWVVREAERLRGLGYAEVHILKPDDNTTTMRLVKVEKAKAKDFGKLSCYLRVRPYGEVEVLRDMTTPKQATAVEKDKDGKKKTTPEKVKPLKADELNWQQEAILGYMAVDHLRGRILAGDLKGDFLQWAVVANQFGVGDTKESFAFLRGPGSNGFNYSESMWSRFEKEYPGFVPKGRAKEQEKLDQGPEVPGFKGWLRLKKPKRDALFAAAIAAMFMPEYNPLNSHGGIVEALGELPVKEGWLVPGQLFFEKFRTDQLMDYLKRVKHPDADKPLKKTEAVQRAVEAAKAKGVWTFGI